MNQDELCLSNVFADIDETECTQSFSSNYDEDFDDDWDEDDDDDDD